MTGAMRTSHHRAIVSSVACARACLLCAWRQSQARHRWTPARPSALGGVSTQRCKSAASCFAFVLLRVASGQDQGLLRPHSEARREGGRAAGERKGVVQRSDKTRGQHTG